MLQDCRVHTDKQLFFSTSSQLQRTLNFVGIPQELTRSLIYVWGFVYIILVALWVSEDSKSYPDIYRPFEFGYLVFLFYVAYLPYYLIKTRGFIKGIAYLVSLIILFNVAGILQWLLFWIS